MKHYEKIIAPAKEHLELVDTTCDLCKKSIDYRDGEAEMNCRFGYFPGDDVVMSEFDVCGNCWKSVILPIMQAAGAAPRITGGLDS